MSSVSILPKGANLTRYAIAQALSPDLMGAQALAAFKWGEGSAPAQMLKAAVSAGSEIPNDSWGSELRAYNAAASEFVELVRQASIVGRLAGLRRIPLSTRTFAQNGGASASWRKAGRAAPASAMSFAQQTLAPLGVTALSVITNELLKFGDSSSERVITADLVRAVTEQMDAAFIDILNAGEVDVSPAAITYGSPQIESTGYPTDDLAALIAEFEGDLASAYLVTDPLTATRLAMVKSTISDCTGCMFPDAGPRGGSVLGIPLLTSRSSPRSGSPATGQIALVDPTGIVVGDGTATVRVTRQASIELLDNPVGDGIAATTLVSLWQINAVGIAAQLTTNWHRARPGSVAVLTGCDYGA